MSFHSSRPARFRSEPLEEVMAQLAAQLSVMPPGGVLYFEAVDPDLNPDRFSGELVSRGPTVYRHRHHAAWMELAEALGCCFQTPERVSDDVLRFGFRKLDPSDSWHMTALPSGDPDKYGADTAFARIDKFEQPAFLAGFRRALSFLTIPERPRVLSLGVGTGRELAHVPGLGAGVGVGVDHCPTAIAVARQSYPQFDFICGDLRQLSEMELGRFDLVMAINTFQGSLLCGAELLRTVVSDLLTSAGGVLIGVPNCRYVGSALRYGVDVRHRRGPEYTPVLKDVMRYRRYLQQHRFDVTVTGKHTVLVAGKKIAPAQP